MKKQLGQYFTPLFIVDKMISLIQNQGSILEPSCGDGAFFNKIPNCIGIEIDEKYFNRLEYEVSVIKKMGFPGYFLIVSDFIKWSKGHGVPVGPGRGSGAGSIAAYAIEITNIDPMKYNLLFERFLNPERLSMPKRNWASTVNCLLNRCFC